MGATRSRARTAAAARAALALDRGAIVRVVAIAVFLAIALFVLPTIGADWTTTFTSVAIYSIITLGLGILYGRVGLISLGQVALLVIGRVDRDPPQLRHRPLLPDRPAPQRR